MAQRKKGTSVSTRPSWPDRFLKELPKRGTIGNAAAAVGVSRRTVYRELEANPDFAADVREARAECVQLLEGSMYERAMAGDNTLSIFLMKGYDPERFGDGLRAQQIAQIKAEALREVQAQLEDDIAKLPPRAREIVIGAMRKRAELQT